PEDRPAGAVRNVVLVGRGGMCGVHSVSSNIVYDSDTVSWCAGSSGATTNCSSMSRPSPGSKVWFVKQKHSIFLKCFAASPGATLGTDCVVIGSSVRFLA